MQKPAAPGLVVVGEADYKILLVHKLCSPEKYTRQGGMRSSSHHATQLYAFTLPCAGFAYLGVRINI